MNLFIVSCLIVLEISVQWLSVSSYRVLLKPVRNSAKFSPFTEQIRAQEITSGSKNDDHPSSSIAFMPGPPYEESSETSETVPFKPLPPMGFQPVRTYDSFRPSSPPFPRVLPGQRENYTENLFTTGSNKLKLVTEEKGGIHRKKSAFNPDSQKPRESSVLLPFKSEYPLFGNAVFSNADILQKFIQSPNYKVYAKPITSKQVHTWDNDESGDRNGLLSHRAKSQISPAESFESINKGKGMETLLKYNGNNYWMKPMRGTKASHETNRNVPQSLLPTLNRSVPPNFIQNPSRSNDGFVELSKLRALPGSGNQREVNGEKLNSVEYSAGTFPRLTENNSQIFSKDGFGGNNGMIFKSFLKRNQDRKLNSTKSEIFRPAEAGSVAAAESSVRSQAAWASPAAKPGRIKIPTTKKSCKMRIYNKKKSVKSPDKSKFLLKQQQQQQQLSNIPAIRYINSLTMAHFAGPNSSSFLHEFKRALTEPPNLTRVLNYLRANKTIYNEDAAAGMSSDFRGQKPREFAGQNDPILLSNRAKSNLGAASTQQFSNSLNSAPETESRVISSNWFGGKNGGGNLAGEDRIPSIDSGIPTANKNDSINAWIQPNRKFQSVQNAFFEESLIDVSNKGDVKRSAEEIENRNQKNAQTSKGVIRNRYRRETVLTNEKGLQYGSNDVTGGKNEIRSGDEEILEKTSVEILRSQETKRPLTRLSGLDFLTRYHKKKSKPNQRVDDFWKVTTHNSNDSASKTPMTNIKIVSVKLNESTKPIKDTLDEVNKQRLLNRNLPEKTSTRAPPRYTRKLRILVTAPPPSKNRNLQPKTKETNQTRSSPPSAIEKVSKIEIKTSSEKTVKKLFIPEVTTSKQSLPKLESSTKVSLVADKHPTLRPTEADEGGTTKAFTIRVPKYSSVVRDPVSHEAAEEVTSAAPIQTESKILPFTEAFETEKKFFREKLSENIPFRPRPILVTNQETWKDKYLPEVSTLRSNFHELGLTPRPIPQIESAKEESEGNEEPFKPKTIQYEVVTRNPVTWRAADLPEVSSPRYNFQEYAGLPTVTIIPKETFPESKELRQYKDYDVEGLRPKPLQYTTIDRNREPWKSEEPQVSPLRPSYRGFEPSIKIIEIGEGHKPAAERQPEIIPFSPLLTPFGSINQNGEPWKSEYSPEVSTLRSAIQIIVEPLTPKPVAYGNDTDDKPQPNQQAPDSREVSDASETYENGPVLYYIVNEKTGRGRWISYPSDKHKHKLEIPKKRRKFRIDKNKNIKQKKQ